MFWVGSTVFTTTRKIKVQFTKSLKHHAQSRKEQRHRIWEKFASDLGADIGYTDLKFQWFYLVIRFKFQESQGSLPSKSCANSVSTNHLAIFTYYRFRYWERYKMNHKPTIIRYKNNKRSYSWVSLDMHVTRPSYPWLIWTHVSVKVNIWLYW